MNTARWDWLNTFFLIGTLLLALILVPVHLMRSHHLLVELATAFFMYAIIGMGVTAGYHRLFSHKTYRAKAFTRFMLLCLGSASFENSALRWANDHRAHHRYTDTDRDPYAVRKGFWHAHWLWVMEAKTHPLTGVDDLLKDPLVRWQDRYYMIIGAVVTCLPLILGLMLHDFWGFVVITVLLRIVVTHHSTFLINSAAHWFGSQPYSDSSSARDNPLLAPFTFGEGYHNFHHKWPGDYRNGVRWYQFDSTKWFLNLLAWLGLAADFRRIPDPVIRRAQLSMEEKRLLAKVANVPPSLAEKLQTRIASAHDRLDRALASFQTIQQARTAGWKTAMLEHRAELQVAWSEWKAARFVVKHMI